MRKIFAFLFLAVVVAGGIPAAPARAQEVLGSGSLSSNPPVVSQDLYFGVRNSNQVMSLQSFLQNRGYYDGPVTGNFFGMTLAAVKRFQQAHGVPATGYFGPMSRGVINRIAEGPLTIVPPSPILNVGENMQLTAMYQPPMPPCPEGMYCAQVMPAPFEVEVEWASQNPAVARVEKTVVQCFTTPCPPQVRLHGESAGSTLITATYVNDKGAKISATAFVQVKRTGYGTLEISPAVLDLKVGESKEVGAWFMPPLPPCAYATSGAVCKIAAIRTPVDVHWSVLNPGTKIVAKAFRSCPNSVSRCPMATTTVTGLEPGVAELTATYFNELGEMKQATVKISVQGDAGNSIQVRTPNGGEVLSLGGIHSIQWRSLTYPVNAGLGTVDIGLRRASGPVAYIARGVPDRGEFSWNTAQYLSDGTQPVSGTDYRIIISAPPSQDESDNPFALR